MKTEYRVELEKVRAAAGGILYPEDVVEFAKNKHTALHQCFEWDDTEAAHQHRLWQARTLIRVAVVVGPENTESTRAYVSLTVDKGKSRGYRAIVDVLNDKDLKARMLDDARDDLLLFRKKYEVLKDMAELKGLFVEIDNTLCVKIKKRA